MQITEWSFSFGGWRPLKEARCRDRLLLSSEFCSWNWQCLKLLELDVKSWVFAECHGAGVMQIPASPVSSWIRITWSEHLLQLSRRVGGRFEIIWFLGVWWCAGQAISSAASRTIEWRVNSQFFHWLEYFPFWVPYLLYAFVPSFRLRFIS